MLRLLPSLTISFWIVANLSPTVIAADASGKSPQAVSQFVTKHCVECHEGESAEARFDVTQLRGDLDDAESFRNWMKVFDRVHDGEMPPKDSNNVKPNELKLFLTTSSEWLTNHQRQQWQELGRVQGRRLTNLQLERTLHNLLGVDIPLASLMPEEQRTAGFTSVASGQPMSHFQLEQHLKVVDAALDEAFRRAIEKDELVTKTFDAKGLSRTDPRRRTREPEVIDNFAVTWSSRLIFYGRIPATTARRDGWYRFTFRAKALNSPQDHGVWCTVRTGKCVSTAPLLSWVGAFEATDDVQEWTFETWLPRGEMLEIRPGDDTLKMARFDGGQVGTGEGGPQNVPGVAVESLTMEQIHLGADDDSIHENLFGDLVVKRAGRDWHEAKLESKAPKVDARRLMTDFASRAFRRPVTETEVEPFVQLVIDALDDGEPLLHALRSGYRALLCSPRFLYFNETPGKLDNFALASRLSYFLWSTMPDAELLSFAEKQQLTKENVLRAQVVRMLNDPKGQNFVKDFAAQWLDLSLIDFTTPDRRLYPNFDVIVQQSMLAETHSFLQEMLEKNLSVKLLIDSDYTYLNERLARFYDIDRVKGDDLQRVSLTKDDHRGGLLTQGAIMKVTANGTNTSPVIRGVWVSERILGIDIPPPPAGVPAIEPDIRGATTIRDMLEKHKSNPSCASCHTKIDPPGFALENFDPAGQWRDTYPKFEGRSRVKGTPIDTSFTLTSGEPFKNLDEFQRLVSEKQPMLARNVAEKLIAYGTGATISFADRNNIDVLVAKTKKDNYGLRSILTEVVMSDLFRSK